MRAPAPALSGPGPFLTSFHLRDAEFRARPLSSARAGTPWRSPSQRHLDSLFPAPLAPTVVTTLCFPRPGPSGTGRSCPCAGASGSSPSNSPHPAALPTLRGLPAGCPRPQLPHRRAGHPDLPCVSSGAVTVSPRSPGLHPFPAGPLPGFLSPLDPLPLPPGPLPAWSRAPPSPHCLLSLLRLLRTRPLSPARSERPSYPVIPNPFSAQVSNSDAAFLLPRSSQLVLFIVWLTLLHHP